MPYSVGGYDAVWRGNVDVNTAQAEAASKRLGASFEQSAKRAQGAWGGFGDRFLGYIMARQVSEISRRVLQTTENMMRQFNQLLTRGFATATATTSAFAARFINDMIRMGKSIDTWRASLEVSFRDIKTGRLGVAVGAKMMGFGMKAALYTPAQLPDVMGTLAYMARVRMPVGNLEEPLGGAPGYFKPIADIQALFMTQGVNMENVAYMINMIRQGRWRRGQRFGITRGRFKGWAQQRGYGGGEGLFQMQASGGGMGAALTPQGDVAFQRYLTELFGGGAGRMMETLPGAMSNIQDIYWRLHYAIREQPGSAYQKLTEMGVRAERRGVSWVQGRGPEDVATIINRAGVGALEWGERQAGAAAGWVGKTFRESLRGQQPIDYAEAMAMTGIKGAEKLGVMGIEGLTKMLGKEKGGPLAEAGKRLMGTALDTLVAFLGRDDLANAIEKTLTKIAPPVMKIYMEQLTSFMPALVKGALKGFWDLSFKEKIGMAGVGGMKSMAAPLGGALIGMKMGGGSLLGKAVGALLGALAASGLALGATMVPSMIGGGGPAKKQAGGFIGGSGEIPIIAHGGEFMMNAGATKQYLPMLKAMNAQSLLGGGEVLYPKPYLGPESISLRGPGGQFTGQVPYGARGSEALSKLGWQSIPGHRVAGEWSHLMYRPGIPEHPTQFIDAWRLRTPGIPPQMIDEARIAQEISAGRLDPFYDPARGRLTPGARQLSARQLRGIAREQATASVAARRGGAAMRGLRVGGRLARGLGRGAVYHLAETGIRAGGEAAWAGLTYEGRKRYWQEHAGAGYGLDWGALGSPGAKQYGTVVARNIMGSAAEQRAWGQEAFTQDLAQREGLGGFLDWHGESMMPHMKALERYQTRQMIDEIEQQDRRINLNRVRALDSAIMGIPYWEEMKRGPGEALGAYPGGFPDMGVAGLHAAEMAGIRDIMAGRASMSTLSVDPTSKTRSAARYQIGKGLIYSAPSTRHSQPADTSEQVFVGL